MADLTTAPQATTKAKKYRVNARKIYQYPDMVTVVPQNLTEKMGPLTAVVSVALGDKAVKRTLPAKKDRPAVEVVVEPATQEQLKYLYEVEKNPLVEAYD